MSKKNNQPKRKNCIVNNWHHIKSIWRHQLEEGKSTRKKNIWKKCREKKMSERKPWLIQPPLPVSTIKAVTILNPKIPDSHEPWRGIPEYAHQFFICPNTSEFSLHHLWSINGFFQAVAMAIVAAGFITLIWFWVCLCTPSKDALHKAILGVLLIFTMVMEYFRAWTHIQRCLTLHQDYVWNIKPPCP